MRLNASKFGLFASLLGVVVGQQTATKISGENPETSASSGPYIDFDTFKEKTVFAQQEGDERITWSATLDSHLTVKEVKLYKENQDGGNQTLIGKGQVESLADTSASSGKRAGIQKNEGVSPPQDGPLPPENLGPFDIKVTPISMNQFAANLTVASDANAFKDVWNDKVLYMEVISVNKTNIARSYSPGFMVVNSMEDGVINGARAILNNWSESERPSDTIEPATTITASPTSTVTPTSSAQSSANPDLSQGSSSDSGSSGGGGGGLSSGAIAGIAVGVAVVVLAVAGFLVWYLCCFRRRRGSAAASSAGGGFSRAHDGPYGAGSGAAVIMAEKEAAAAGLAESRERLSLAQDRDLLSGSAAGMSSSSAAAAAAAAAPYSPYTDHNTPGMAVTTTGTDSQASLPLPLQPPHYHSRSRSAATATPPPPIESHYAHLIEEGMTQDEIRRLEEEERQLDAAIEEAGSSNNNSSSSNRQATPPRQS